MVARGWLEANAFVSSRVLIVAKFFSLVGAVYVVLPAAPITDQNNPEYKVRRAAAKAMFGAMMNRNGTSKAQLQHSTAEMFAESFKTDSGITKDQAERIVALFASLIERYYEDLQAATVAYYARYYSPQDIETYSRWLDGGGIGRLDRALRIGLTTKLYGHELQSTLSDLADRLDEDYRVIGEKAKAIAKERS